MTVLIFYFDRKDGAYEKKIFMLDFGDNNAVFAFRRL